MKVWITKYALTTGIFMAEVEETHTPTMVSDKMNSYHSRYHKPDWHLTEAEAIEQAEKMVLRKIKSVQKQLDKLNKMTF